MSLLRLLLLLFSCHCDALRPGDHKDGAGDDESRLDITHLHLEPSTYRSRNLHEDDPPWVTVTFSLGHSVGNAFQLSFPLGYELVSSKTGDHRGCDELVVKDAGSFAKERNAQPLRANSDIISCEAKFEGTDAASKRTTPGLEEEVGEERTEDEEELKKERAVLVLRVRDGLRGLSEPVRTATDSTHAVWYYLQISVWLPRVSPHYDDNVFKFAWSKTPQDQEWKGVTTYEGWPVLGDWGCMYSDWEGWGTCSAQCGGGLQRRSRRMLLGSASGEACAEPLNDTEPCNLHECAFHCELEDSSPIFGTCSAECGGGVRTVKRKWRGKNCPSGRDEDALDLQPCNTHPCSRQCKLADAWTVLTPCSEFCGPGTFWVYREVLEKELGDDTCQADLRELPCMRQPCADFLVMNPHMTMKAYTGSIFRVAIMFATPFTTSKITVTAPKFFTLEPSSSKRCQIYYYDMFPRPECEKVHNNKFTLTPLVPLPKSEHMGRGVYQFLIDVHSTDCPDEGKWFIDEMGDEVTCMVESQHNRWHLELQEHNSVNINGLHAVGVDMTVTEDWVHKIQKDNDITELETEIPDDDDDSSEHFSVCTETSPCDPGLVCSDRGVCETQKEVDKETHQAAKDDPGLGSEDHSYERESEPACGKPTPDAGILSWGRWVWVPFRRALSNASPLT